MSDPLGSIDGVQWLRTDGREGDVVLSSRVRLARNINGLPFLSRATIDDRRHVMKLVRQHAARSVVGDTMEWFDLETATRAEREILVERHLISKQHAKGDEPRGLCVSFPEERLAVMVNEEDHLRIQLMRSGLALSEAWEQIDRFDDELESRVGYAFHRRMGYLTACPTNVGTGIRVSVMLHLPGLKLTGEIDKARRAAKAMSLAVRGFYGEGSEANGDLYQISNQTTLGKSEMQILEEFEHSIIPDIIRFERQSRETLLDRRRPMLEDRVQRALGTLLYARLLNAEETMQLLSQVRLGVLTGVLEGVELRTIAELQLLTQPAHLQRAVGETLDQAQRRRARADYVRERLGA